MTSIYLSVSTAPLSSSLVSAPTLLLLDSSLGGLARTRLILLLEGESWGLGWGAGVEVLTAVELCWGGGLKMLSVVELCWVGVLKMLTVVESCWGDDLKMPPVIESSLEAGVEMYSDVESCWGASMEVPLLVESCWGTVLIMLTFVESCWGKGDVWIDSRGDEEGDLVPEILLMSFSWCSNFLFASWKNYHYKGGLIQKLTILDKSVWSQLR